MLQFVLQCSMNEVWPASALLVKPGIEKIWNRLWRNVARGNFGKTAPQYLSEGKEFRAQ